MHNKAPSVAALCGHNPNWSAFAIRSRNTAATATGFPESIGDCIPILYDVERCLESTRLWASLEWDGLADSES
jgi:hypothetical protein